MLRRFEEAKKFEEFSRTMERERKGHLMADLKSDMQKYSQVKMLIECNLNI